MDDILKVQGINSKGYGSISKLVMQDRRLSIQAKAIYAYFCSYAGNGKTAFPRRDKIIADLGVSKDTYYKHFNMLRDCGYIETEQEHKNGRLCRNIYTLPEFVPLKSMRLENQDAESIRDKYQSPEQSKIQCPKFSDTEKQDTEKQDTEKDDTEKQDTEKDEYQSPEQPKIQCPKLSDTEKQDTVFSDTSKSNSIKRIDKIDNLSLNKSYPIYPTHVRKNEKAERKGLESEKEIKNKGSYFAVDKNQSVEVMRQVVKNNLDYDILVERFECGKERIGEIVELIVEVICSKRESIRIAGDDKPIGHVKERFMSLNSCHVQYVIECLESNTTNIRNMKKYMLTALYNAPTTIDSYYAAKVAHDMNM